MVSERKSSAGPVTALIVREVKPHRQDDFEKWLAGMNRVVKGFEGHLGTDLIRPRNRTEGEYVIIVRFDEYEHLKAWMASSERADWLKKSEDMTTGAMHVQEAHGFEPWFTLPGRSSGPAAPARYKMAALTVLALYPPLLLLTTILSFFLQGWPRPVVMLANVALLVPAMTYFIMPWMTHLFRRWLYP